MEESISINDEELEYLIYLNVLKFAQLDELNNMIQSLCEKLLHSRMSNSLKKDEKE